MRGAGKETDPPPPPNSSGKLGREPIRGMKGERGEVPSFLFSLPRALLHLFLAVAPTFAQYYEKTQLETLATQATRKVNVAKFENFSKTEASL